MKNLPKPAVIGVAVVLILIALVVIYKTVGSGGENAAFGSKAEIERREAAGSGKARPSNGAPPAQMGSPSHYGSPQAGSPSSGGGIPPGSHPMMGSPDH